MRCGSVISMFPVFYKGRNSRMWKRRNCAYLGASFPSLGKPCVFQVLLSKHELPEINETGSSD